MPELAVEIVSPDGSIFKGDAQGVRAPGVEGSFEVLYNHAPMVAAFGVGSIRVTTAAGDDVHYATSGGFLEVLDNSVIILAETAEPASAIDMDRAQAAEQRALEHLQSAEGEAARVEAEKALERARNRARVAMGQVGRHTSG